MKKTLIILLFIPVLLYGQRTPRKLGYINVDSVNFTDGTTQTTAFTVDTVNSIIVDTVTTMINDTANVLRSSWRSDINDSLSLFQGWNRDSTYQYEQDSGLARLTIIQDSSLINRQELSDSLIFVQTGDSISPKTADKLGVDTMNAIIYKIDDFQMLRLPDQTTNEGSFIVGNGGSNLTYSTGDSGKYNFLSGVDVAYSLTKGFSNYFTGYQAGYLNTTGSINIFNGYQAGYSNISGNYNIFNGYQAGYSNTLNYNIANGYQAGLSNSSGIGWFANGYRAGYLNTSGNGWIASGFQAATANVSGGYWIAIGDEAGKSNTSGSYWIAVGRQAAQDNLSGSRFMALGYRAAHYNTSGSSFIAIGDYSARFLVDGSTPATNFTNSVYIGVNARVSSNSTPTNENVFGYAAEGMGSNTVSIGNSSITDNYFNTTSSSNTIANNGLMLYNSNATSNNWANIFFSPDGDKTNSGLFSYQFTDRTALAEYGHFESEVMRNGTSVNWLKAYGDSIVWSIAGTRKMRLASDGLHIADTTFFGSATSKVYDSGDDLIIDTDSLEINGDGNNSISLYDALNNKDVYIATSGNSYLKGGALGIKIDPVRILHVNSDLTDMSFRIESSTAKVGMEFVDNTATSKIYQTAGVLYLDPDGDETGEIEIDDDTTLFKTHINLQSHNISINSKEALSDGEGALSLNEGSDWASIKVRGILNVTEDLYVSNNIDIGDTIFVDAKNAITEDTDTLKINGSGDYASVEISGTLKALDLTNTENEYQVYYNPITKEVTAAERTHGFIAFEDSSVSITINTINVWEHVTNATDNLFTTIEDENISISGDTIILNTDGHYEFVHHIGGDGSNTQTYETRIYNITQTTGILGRGIATMRGSGNYDQMSNTAYCTDCNDGDSLVVQIRNISGTGNSTVRNGSVFIKLTHTE